VTTSFPERVLRWFDEHGRKDLPWQQSPTAYRVWVSEIMLQQTQVATVIPYYQRFVERFPAVEDLAAASEDEVLHHWTGLGYYARARNLHATARYVAGECQGAFPTDLDSLQALPGIGRSTAGAIASLAQGQRAVILDGNVKRVLARHQAIAGWPGHTAVAKTLWNIADRLTPEKRVAAYNQAMMDLGATLCTRRNPRCGDCPVGVDCAARRAGDPHDYPASKPRRERPVREVTMLLLRDDSGRVLLEQRPPTGVWGGLWCLPELSPQQDVHAWCRDQIGVTAEASRRLSTRRHSFSHFHLDIEPVEILLNAPGCRVLEGFGRLWYNLASPENIGLAAPVVRLLNELTGSEKDGVQDG
jgi:A/G-specific adenine glycosylase